MTQRRGSVEDSSVHEMNVVGDEAQAQGLANWVAIKSQRSKQLVSEMRVLDGNLTELQNRLARLERLYTAQLQSKNKRESFLGLSVLAGTIACGVIWGIIGALVFLLVGWIPAVICDSILSKIKGDPEVTKKSAEECYAKIPPMESNKSALSRKYGQEMAKYDGEISKLRDKVEATCGSSYETSCDTVFDYPISSEDGISNDDITANEYMYRAEQGDADAQFNLAGYYEQGLGVKANPTMAFKWHLKAAEQGHVGSQSMLGIYYLKGIGTTINNAQAIRWLLKAAEHGYDRAQFILGICYLKGTGVKTNEGLAISLFRKAADQGHTGAQEMLMRLY